MKKRPICPKCDQPMRYRLLTAPRDYVCMDCAVKAFGRAAERNYQNELVPIGGWAWAWAWKTDDGWHASQAVTKPAIAKFVKCKIMIPRKYAEAPITTWPPPPPPPPAAAARKLDLNRDPDHHHHHHN